MFGVIVNAASIVIGGIFGTIIKERFSEKVSKAVMEVMGLVSVFIGFQGALKGEKILVVLISMVIGTTIGTMIDLNKYIVNFGEFLKKKFASGENINNLKFVDAFVSTSILFGIGAMAILGSIEAGIKHEYSIFFLKSLMDFISAMMYATTMGIGVCFSSITIFVFQGTMTLCAGLIKPLTENAGLMNEIVCCGNIMIIAIGLNILNITKIKVANIIPSLLFVPIIYFLINL